MSASDNAREFLLGCVHRAGSEPGVRLPTIASLARSAGVAHRTMWKAVRGLVVEGVLEARPRSGIRIAARGAEPSAPPPAQPGRSHAWERVRVALEHDLARGRFLPGMALPPIVQLCRDYGAYYTTMRRALLSLVDDSLLETSGRGYRVRPLRAGTRRPALVFIAHVPGETLQSAMELEALRAGAELLTLPLFPYRPLLRTLRSLRGRAEDIAGVVISILGGFPFQYQDILAAVLPAGVPVSIIDPSGGASRPPRPPHRLLRTFTLADFRTQGEIVGRHLLDQGHRRVAYLSPMSDNGWAAERLEGLRETLLRADRQATVDVFALSPDTVPEHAQDYYASLLDSSLKRLSPAGDAGNVLAQAIRQHGQVITLAAEWRERAKLQQPLMRRALTDHSITAWVACNDHAALIALDYLRSRRIRVPGRLSVIGFDDMPAASAAGLSSYNRNVTAAVHGALGHVFGSRPRYRRERQNRPITIEGFVTARASSRRNPLLGEGTEAY